MKPFLAGRSATASSAAPASVSPLTGFGCLRQNTRHHAHDTGDRPSAPTVDCVHQDGKVVRLIVTCTCGERIEVDCQYPDTP